MTNFDKPKTNKNSSETAGGGSDAENLANNLENRLNTKESGPQVKVNIFLGTHASEQDAKLLRDPLKEADIFIPELSGWTPNFKYALEDVVHGRKTPEVILQEQDISPQTNPMFGFMKGQLEVLYNSNKLIAFADVSSENSIRKRLSDAHTRTEVTRSTLGKIIQTIRMKLQEQSEAQLKREDFLITQLEKEINNILINHPELMKKKEVNVLMFLGAAHTRVYHILNRGGKDVSREFGKLPQVYDYNTEAMRRYMFGKEVSYELAARVAMEDHVSNLMYTYLISISQDYDIIHGYIRKIIERFSLEEIKQILESNDSESIFSDSLEKKGIYRPVSEADMSAFIAPKK